MLVSAESEMDSEKLCRSSFYPPSPVGRVHLPLTSMFPSLIGWSSHASRPNAFSVTKLSFLPKYFSLDIINSVSCRSLALDYCNYGNDYHKLHVFHYEKFMREKKLVFLPTVEIWSHFFLSNTDIFLDNAEWHWPKAVEVRRWSRDMVPPSDTAWAARLEDQVPWIQNGGWEFGSWWDTICIAKPLLSNKET